MWWNYKKKFAIAKSRLTTSKLHNVLHKGQLFWEGHKNLIKISHFVLTLLSNFKKKVADIFKSYALLTISELYPLFWQIIFALHILFLHYFLCTYLFLSTSGVRDRFFFVVPTSELSIFPLLVKLSMTSSIILYAKIN
jgi:hypothetical protein